MTERSQRREALLTYGNVFVRAQPNYTGPVASEREVVRKRGDARRAPIINCEADA